MDFLSNYKCKENLKRIELTPWFYYDVFHNGKRTIHVPSPELKRVQRLILRKYFKEFWQQMSVKEVASAHCGKKWLMKLDIKDFFNSITEEQIKEVIHHYVTLYESPVQIRRTDEADVEQIFSMCTIEKKLPTGAPTSPYIANLLLREFDFEIEEFCRSYNVQYSRYMDDLFFSTDKPQYILSLVELEVLRQLKELGFKINVDKIKYISSNKRQQVLGLGINNKKPVLTKEGKRKYRAYFYNVLSPLIFNKQKNYKEHEAEILGHLAYIKSVDSDYCRKIVLYIFKLVQKLNIKHKTCLGKLLKTIDKL